MVFLTPVIIVIGITAVHLATFGDLFLSTGWGLLLVSNLVHKCLFNVIDVLIKRLNYFHCRSHKPASL